MWRRFHFHSRAINAMTVNVSPGSPYGGQAGTNKNMAANDKVVFTALGAFFGLMLLLFGIQIYVRCICRRLEIEATELEEESEEMSRNAIYIREIGAGRRNWRRRLNHYFDERNESSSPAQHIPRGLDKSLLELLPTFLFSMDVASKDKLVCAVCLEDFVDGDRTRLLPKCSHCFHVQCIDTWFLSHSSCPLCRCEVTLPSPETGSSRLLQTNQNCPDLPSDRSELDRSEQQEQETQQSAPPFLQCPTVSYPASASIVDNHVSNNVLCLERGSSFTRRAAAIALESTTIAEEENTTNVASSVLTVSPRHTRNRSYVALEINGEYRLDASGATSSSIHEVRLQPA